jgi:hypothetical protein
VQLDADSIPLIRERYGYARAEIIHRLDNRYKLLQHLLALVAVAITVIAQLHWDFIGLLMCVLLLLLTFVLYAENKHIMLLSDYMTSLERILDTHYQLDSINIDAKGWERVSRARHTGKSAATFWLLTGAVFFLFFTYGFFNVVGSRAVHPKLAAAIWTFPSFLSWIQPPRLWLLIAIVQLPCAAVIIHFYAEYRRFWRPTDVA